MNYCTRSPKSRVWVAPDFQINGITFFRITLQKKCRLVVVCQFIASHFLNARYFLFSVEKRKGLREGKGWRFFEGEVMWSGVSTCTKLYHHFSFKKMMRANHKIFSVR
jgi:hypothetical protein